MALIYYRRFPRSFVGAVSVLTFGCAREGNETFRVYSSKRLRGNKTHAIKNTKKRGGGREHGLAHVRGRVRLNPVKAGSTELVGKR